MASVSIPAIVMSRVGFRAIMITVTITYFFYFATLTLKQQGKHKLRYSALAGLFFGLNLYTYIASRVLSVAILFLVVAAGLIDWRLGFSKNFLLKHKAKIFIGLTAALVTLIPLINYFWSSPDAFIGRAGHVSVFNPDLNGGSVIKTLILNAKKTVLMFGWQGDLNWRHNVSGQPFFDRLTATLFYLAVLYLSIDTVINLYLALVKRRWWVRKKLFIQLALWTWFLSALAPMVVTAESIPHFLRAEGIIPVVFILPAWLIYQIMVYLKNRGAFNTKGLNIVLLVFCVYLITRNFYVYFIYAYNQPQNYYAFRSDLSLVSDYLNQRKDQWHTFLVLDEFSVQTVKFLTMPTSQPYKLVKPELAFAWDYTSDRQIMNRQKVVIFTQSTVFDAIKFKQAHPEARLIETVKNRWGQTVMEVYEL